MFVYFWERERERERERRRGAEIEGDTEPESGSKLYAVCTEPDSRFKLMNHQIMT